MLPAGGNQRYINDPYRQKDFRFNPDMYHCILIIIVLHLGIL